jgi:hypothetical protein
VQALPHAPQLLESVLRLAQVPPHCVCWVGHPPLDVQAPATQTSWPPHALPQEPQFWKLICVSTQRPLQSCVPAGQVQDPCEQICPAPQFVPQPPQLAVSLCVSTHAPAQATRGAVHPLEPSVPPAHVPELQT